VPRGELSAHQSNDNERLSPSSSYRGINLATLATQKGIHSARVWSPIPITSWSSMSWFGRFRFVQSKLYLIWAAALPQIFHPPINLHDCSLRYLGSLPFILLPSICCYTFVFPCLSPSIPLVPSTSNIGSGTASTRSFTVTFLLQGSTSIASSLFLPPQTFCGRINYIVTICLHLYAAFTWSLHVASASVGFAFRTRSSTLHMGSPRRLSLGRLVGLAFARRAEGFHPCVG
jgi:hypothetical protein